MFDIEPDGDIHGECAEEIKRLAAALKKANDQTEHFEREWYLCKDKLESWQISKSKITAEIMNTLDFFDAVTQGDLILSNDRDADKYASWKVGGQCFYAYAMVNAHAD